MGRALSYIYILSECMLSAQIVERTGNNTIPASKSPPNIQLKQPFANQSSEDAMKSHDEETARVGIPMADNHLRLSELNINEIGGIGTANQL